MNNKLIKEIYETYQEWKGSAEQYRHFLDTYVEMIIHEKPQNQHENYYTYWESLKKTEQMDNETWNNIVNDIYCGR